jgi:hypothetical protein
VNTSQAANALYIMPAAASRDLPDFARHAQEQGWDACVVATPSGMKFLDPARLAHRLG